MPDQVPFQIVTRAAARRRAEEEEELALAASLGLPTFVVTAASPSPAPPSPRAVSRQLLMVPRRPRRPRRPRNRTTATRQSVTTQTPQAGSSNNRGAMVGGNSRTRRRRPAPFRRHVHRRPVRPRAADGQQGVNAGIVNTPQSVESGLQLFDNPLPAETIDADEYQGNDQPEQHQSGHDTPQSMESGLQLFDNLVLAETIDADEYQGHDQPEQHQSGHDTPQSVEQGHQLFDSPLSAETIDANEYQGRDQPEQNQFEHNFTYRCTSPQCPVPATIPHNRGFYQHDGQPNLYAQRYLFGQSNPPPAVWLMIRRIQIGAQQPGDQEAVDAFSRNHYFQEHPPFATPFIFEDLFSTRNM